MFNQIPTLQAWKTASKVGSISVVRKKDKVLSRIDGLVVKRASNRTSSTASAERRPTSSRR